MKCIKSLSSLNVCYLTKYEVFSYHCVVCSSHCILRSDNFWTHRLPPCRRVYPLSKPLGSQSVPYFHIVKKIFIDHFIESGVGSQTSTLTKGSASSVSWSTNYSWANNPNNVKSCKFCLIIRWNWCLIDLICRHRCQCGLKHGERSSSEYRQTYVFDIDLKADRFSTPISWKVLHLHLQVGPGIIKHNPREFVLMSRE